VGGLWGDMDHDMMLVTLGSMQDYIWNDRLYQDVNDFGEHMGLHQDASTFGVHVGLYKKWHGLP